MKKRIALFSGCLALAAGAAAAIPTAHEVQATGPATVLPGWDEIVSSNLDADLASDFSLHFAAPAAQQESMKLAVYYPCDCTQGPACPFPFPFPFPRPWPPGGPLIYNPFPHPGPCGPFPFPF